MAKGYFGKASFFSVQLIKCAQWVVHVQKQLEITAAAAPDTLKEPPLESFKN